MAASLEIYNTTQSIPFTATATGLATITNPTLYGGSAAKPTYFSMKIGESYFAELVLATSAGTVDAVLQHSTDGGLTFRNLPLKFAQIATAPGSAGLVFKAAVGLSDAAFAPTGAGTGAAQAANVPFQQKYVGLYLTLGTAGATSGTLNLTIAPKGVVAQ